jgi:O-6-methylguanine DNA methyltransferase
MKTECIELAIATGEGAFVARFSDQGLAELSFPPATPVASELPGISASRRRQVAGWHRLAAAALKQVLAGRAPKRLPPLDWSGATEFQQAVWRQMLKLRPGQTLSYGEMAQAIGRPKAVRAVGRACGANPIPVLVPCHRVLAANGQLGGFSGGLERKRRLLAAEGVLV